MQIPKPIIGNHPRPTEPLEQGDSDFPPGRSGNQKTSSVAVEKGGVNPGYLADNAYHGTQGLWRGRGAQ